jgi:enoyl-CoA hydratase
MIETSEQAGVAVLRMADGKVNAMSIEFCEALTARFEATSTARAVVLTGGGRIFSAGVDLKRLLDGGVPYIRRFLPALSRMLTAVFSCPRPVVAAINGHAIAGGAVLACCADRRIMARGAGRIGVTELLVGLPFPSLAFEAVRATVSARYLPEVVYSGATYEPEAALERGWIDEIAEPSELLGDAVAVAQQLAALSPAAFSHTKAQLRQPVAEHYARSGRATDKTAADIWCAPASLAYIRAYVQRTLKK